MIYTRSLVVPRQLLIALGWLLLLLGAVALGRIGYHRYTHWRWGVPPGVTLMGESMAGLFRPEAQKKVESLGVRYYRLPQEAWFDEATGKVMPETDGQVLDVEATVNRLFAAKPGERVSPVVVPLKARITQRHFQPLYLGDQAQKKVALMINVAWGEDSLQEILEILDREKVRCTFFIVGTWAQKFPGMIKDMASRGHEIANHGMWHGHPTQMSEQERERLIMENQRYMEKLGVKVAPLFAPPYGEVDAAVARTAARLGYYTVMWSKDTVDWKRPAPDVITQRIIQGAEPGGLFLMHPVPETVKALPEAIRLLRQKGLEPAIVSDVLGNPAQERN